MIELYCIAICNKAVIKHETFVNLIDELKLLPSVSEVLVEAYDASVIGMDFYVQKNYRFHVPLNPGLEMQHSNLLTDICNSLFEISFTGQVQAIIGSHNMQAVIKDLFQSVQSGDSVFIHTKPNNDLITANIRNLLMSKKDVNVQHIFRTIQNPTVDIPTPNAMNLELIKKC